MAKFYKNGALPRKLPFGRHQQHGHRGEFDRKRTNRTWNHSSRSPKENYEQCTKHTCSNSCQWTGRFLSVNAQCLWNISPSVFVIIKKKETKQKEQQKNNT